MRTIAQCATARRPAPRRRRGFTLLELLIVVTMMVFIATITLVNYAHVQRVAAYGAVSHDVFNALLMARQRACLDNRTVLFYVLDSTNYVLRQSIGTITYIDPIPDTISPGHPIDGSGRTFADAFNPGLTIQSNSVLVNMTQLALDARVYSFEPSGTVSATNPITGLPFSQQALLLNLVPRGTWHIGDSYGTELFARQTLPKDFEFYPVPVAPYDKVIFRPDGTVDTANGIGGSTRPLIVRERGSIDPNGTNRLVFSISPSGKITQGR
jgi:prepilin-type N-terminal cleavage/methylation domain-containing protein